MDVDAQDIVNQLVLAEIDVHGGYGDEERLEYSSTACVIAQPNSSSSYVEIPTYRKMIHELDRVELTAPCQRTPVPGLADSGRFSDGPN